MRGKFLIQLLKKDPKRGIVLLVMAVILGIVAGKRAEATTGAGHVTFTVSIALVILVTYLICAVWYIMDTAKNPPESKIMDETLKALIEQKQKEKEEAARAAQLPEKDASAPEPVMLSVPRSYEPPEPTPEQKAVLDLELEGHEYDSPEKFREYLREHLPEEIAEALWNRRDLCIPIEYEKTDDSAIPVGASKSGGAPDLPPSIPYPTMCGFRWKSPKSGEIREEYPEESAMQLVMQLNLREVHDPLGRLPKEGMLYIFWSGEFGSLTSNRYAEYECFGDNREVFRVIYYNGLEMLERTQPPCPFYKKYFEAAFESYRVTFSEPKWDIDSYAFTEAAGKASWSVCDFDEYNEEGDKLFGYPTHQANAQPPGEGWKNFLQYDYNAGCIWGLWWYMKENAIQIGFPKDAFAMEEECD